MTNRNTGAPDYAEEGIKQIAVLGASFEEMLPNVYAEQMKLFSRIVQVLNGRGRDEVAVVTEIEEGDQFDKVVVVLLDPNTFGVLEDNIRMLIEAGTEIIVVAHASADGLGLAWFEDNTKLHRFEECDDFHRFEF